MQKETIDMRSFITFRNGDCKIIQAGKMTSRPFVRIRKKNQFS